MPSAAQKDLKFLCQLIASRIADFEAGISLRSRTGYEVHELIAKVAIDRLTLGAAHHREARSAMARRAYRNVISRAYYAMYQTFRGVVFLVNKGDDHEEHKILPSHLPNDFPAKAIWENRLKTARLERNRADYEPYPRGENAFKSRAIQTLAESQQLRTVARVYLRGKGVKV